MTPRDSIGKLRDALVRSAAAVNPSALEEGDRFYIIGFVTGVGVELRHSGTFIGSRVKVTATAKTKRRLLVTVHLDGEDMPREMDPAELGFFELESHAMLVTTRTLDGVRYDHDRRPAEAKQTAK